MNKQFDFTIQKFTEILDCLIGNGYSFQSLEDFLHNPAEKVVILRHDVDRSPLLSMNTARLENSRGDQREHIISGLLKRAIIHW